MSKVSTQSLNGVNVGQLAGTNASEGDLRNPLNHVTKTSPVRDVITNPVPGEVLF